LATGRWRVPEWRFPRRLAAEPIPQAQFESVAVFEEEPVIVAPAGHPPVNRRDGRPRTMIVFGHVCPHRKRPEAWYERRGVWPQRTIELGSYHAMLGCVIAGMGAAPLPKSVLDTFPESDG
jgi:DNA-binding transcriptional LysR family regulator